MSGKDSYGYCVQDDYVTINRSGLLRDMRVIMHQNARVLRFVHKLDSKVSACVPNDLVDEVAEEVRLLGMGLRGFVDTLFDADWHDVETDHLRENLSAHSTSMRGMLSLISADGKDEIGESTPKIKKELSSSDDAFYTHSPFSQNANK